MAGGRRPGHEREGPARAAGRRHRASSPRCRGSERRPRLRGAGGATCAELDRTRRPGSCWDRDPARGRRRPRLVRRGRRARGSIFVGKLIVSKGVDLLLAAWPLVHAANPGARLLMVGFGRAATRSRAALGGARPPATSTPLRELAARGRGLEGGRGGAARDARRVPRRGCRRATRTPPARPPAASPSPAGSSTTRSPSRSPRRDALVFPSTFPEAFGMVAAEAAAAGALPGLGRALGRRRGQPRARGRRCPPSRARPGLVRARRRRGRRDRRPAQRLARARPSRDRAAASASLRETVERLWSWEGVARGVLAASAGELDGLPVPSRLRRLKLASSPIASAPSPRSIESPPGDPRDLCSGCRRDARAHRRDLGRHAPVRLVRRRRLRAGGPDRHPVRRDDRALVASSSRS